MELPISVDRKAVLAENTYLLTLDGDIDFQVHYSIPNQQRLLNKLQLSFKKNLPLPPMLFWS